MSAPDLVVQVQQLDKRLAEVEAMLHRIEQLLTGLQTVSDKETPPTVTKLPRRVRFASPHLRHREQAADFVMVVTRES